MKTFKLILRVLLIALLLILLRDPNHSMAAEVFEIPVEESPVRDILLGETSLYALSRAGISISEYKPKARRYIISGLSDSASISALISELEETTTIPTICVYTRDSAEILLRTEYVDCEVYTLNCPDKYRLDAAPAGIRVRGNSTAFEGNISLIRANQVPYRIKFDKKQMMFGLNSDARCRSWVLLRGEDELLKNDIAFRLGRNILRNGNYCSDGIPVHVYINGCFAGIYELCEQNQINRHRINVNEPPEGYEGTDVGYLLELDNRCNPPYITMRYAGNAKVTDRQGVTKSFKTGHCTLKNDNWTRAQLDFIEKYVNNCFKIIYEACENNKYYIFDENYDMVKVKKKDLPAADDSGNPLDPAEAVADMAVDLDSFVDVFLVYEISMSRDVGEGSFYMCADFSDPDNIKKLTFTGPWDFEWGMGGSTTGSYACEFNSKSFEAEFGERSNPWFVVLMKQEWFVNRVRARWSELRGLSGPSNEDIIERCLEEDSYLLEKYKKDLSRQGSGRITSAKNLIEWVRKRTRQLDKEYLE